MPCLSVAQIEFSGSIVSPISRPVCSMEYGQLVLSKHGRIQSANLNASLLLGYSAKILQDMSLDSILAPPDHATSWELFLQRNDLDSVSMIEDVKVQQGTYVLMSIFFRRFRHETVSLYMLPESAVAAQVIIDRNGKIIQFNRQFSDLLGEDNVAAGDQLSPLLTLSHRTLFDEAFEQHSSPLQDRQVWHMSVRKAPKWEFHPMTMTVTRNDSNFKCVLEPMEKVQTTLHIVRSAEQLHEWAVADAAPSAALIFGYEPSDMIKMPLDRLFLGEAPVQSSQPTWRLWLAEQLVNSEASRLCDCFFKTKDNVVYECLLSAVNVHPDHLTIRLSLVNAYSNAMEDPIDVDGYRLLGVVCEGGFSTIRKAIDLSDSNHGQRVIAKVMERINLSEVVLENGHSILEVEVTALRRLSHPNIVKMLAMEEINNRVYLFLEMCPGMDLQFYAQMHDGLSDEAALRIFSQLFEAVRYLHEEAGIVHRDLKPLNVIVDSDHNFEVKLLDFGVCGFLASDGSDMMSQHVGSVTFAAPEMFLSTSYHGKCADCWSLGAMLIVCVSGNFFVDLGLYVAEERWEEILQDWDCERVLYTSLSDIARHLLHIEPAERWTITQAVEALSQVIKANLLP